MTEQKSNVAFRVAATFTQLHRSFNSQQLDNPVITLWQTAFPTKSGEPSITELIGQVARSLRLLEAQLRLSSILRDGARKSALSITQDLSHITRLETYNQPIRAHTEKLSELRLGSLEACGVALCMEFPELVIQEAEKTTLHDELLNLLAEINASDLEVSAKVAISHYVQAIIWALDRQEFVGSTAVREMAAAVGVNVVDAMNREEQAPDTDKKTSRLATLTKTRNLVAKTLQITFEADVMAHGLLDFVRDASKVLITSAS